MANEPSSLETPTAPADTPAADITVDVDFLTVMARSQQTLIQLGGYEAQANESRRQMMSDFGIGNQTPAVASEPANLP